VPYPVAWRILAAPAQAPDTWRRSGIPRAYIGPQRRLPSEKRREKPRFALGGAGDTLYNSPAAASTCAKQPARRKAGIGPTSPRGV
jgi:hypothetical protein